MTKRIDRIVVVGRDAPTWLCALALQRGLRQEQSTITVLELPVDTVRSDIIAAVPSLGDLHALLGIDDRQLLDACRGVPMVAQRFANWGRSAATFFHGYDPADAEERDFGFLHYWLKARSRGMRVAYEDFWLSAAAAKQGKVPGRSPGGETELPLPSVGYQLEAMDYLAALKQLALKRGIEHFTGTIQAVEHDGERIRAVRSTDDRLFEADMFVDASGSEAALIRTMPGDDFESWKAWFRSDSLLSATAAELSPLPAFPQISAFRAGWLGIHPLQDRTAVIGAYASDIADRDMLHSLPLLAGVQVAGDVIITRFEPGVRRRPWIGNCAAVGSAAAQLEPLDSAQLHFLHSGIAGLVTRVRDTVDEDADSAAYNRAMVRQAEAIRDFQLAHYQSNSRFDEPFWDDARNVSGPPSLDAKLTAFRERGSIPVAPDEPFQETNWRAVLVGHGVIPKAYAPWADQLDEEQHMQMMQSRLHQIGEAVASMPTIAQFLAGSGR